MRTKPFIFPKLRCWPTPNLSARVVRGGPLVRSNAKADAGHMKENYVSTHFLAKQHGGRLEVATKPGPFACLRQSAMSATCRAHRIPRINAARVRAYRSP